MKITMPDYTVIQVKEDYRNRIPYTIKGYRALNNFLLNQQAFSEFHQAICMDRYETMQKILDACIDISEIPMQNDIGYYQSLLLPESK